MREPRAGIGEGQTFACQKQTIIMLCIGHGRNVRSDLRAFSTNVYQRENKAMPIILREIDLIAFFQS